MSKTSQENKAKKAQIAQEETEVKKTAKSRKAETEVEEVASETEVAENSETVKEETVKVTRKRGKKYLDAKKKVDSTKFYPLSEAVELVKKVSLSKFEGKIEAHLTVLDVGNVGEISFPHLDLGSKKIVVLNDTILAEIKEGKVDFDILVATPVTMPKLLPFARILGPKGLMPNPKNGTLTDKPEEAVKKLSVAKTVVKTEKKAPVVHIVVGKTSQPETEIVANVEELIKVVKANKIKKLVLCPTIGPSVKVEVIK